MAIKEIETVRITSGNIWVAGRLYMNVEIVLSIGDSIYLKIDDVWRKAK